MNGSRRENDSYMSTKSLQEDSTFSLSGLLVQRSFKGVSDQSYLRSGQYTKNGVKGFRNSCRRVFLLTLVNQNSKLNVVDVTSI